MDRRTFLASSGILLADQALWPGIGPLNGSKFDTWTINNQSWPMIGPLRVHQGRRYRMMRKGSGDQHPIHLRRHTFKVTRVDTKEFSGLRMDVVNVMPLDSVAVDFIADNPRDTLLHCHQALHMDFGFMQLVKYVG
jgi:FtsP/CotA-like multicopper oxidase with cupredoxin domain